MRRYYREVARPDSMLIVPDGAQPKSKPIESSKSEIEVIGVSISNIFPPQRITSLVIHLDQDCEKLSEAEALALYPNATNVQA